MRARTLAALLLALATAAGADTVVLKSGGVFEGKITAEDEKSVTIQSDGGAMTFRRSDIREIRKTPTHTPEPEPTPEPPRTDPEPKPPTRDPGTAANPPRTDQPPGDLSAIPQSPPLSLPEGVRKLGDTLADIARQVNWPFRPDGGDRDRIVLPPTRQGPLWQVVLDLCLQERRTVAAFQVADFPVEVLELDDDQPFRVGSVQGPALLAAHGMVEDHQFKDDKFQKVEGLLFSLWLDPNGRLLVKEPRLDPPFHFAVDGGAEMEVKPDHESQSPLGGRRWFFYSRPELAGTRADVRLRVPLWAAHEVAEATAPWAANQETRVGDHLCRVVSVARQKANLRDPEDPFKKVEVDELVAQVHLVHAAGALITRLQQESRQPTPEEQETLRLPEESMVLAGHEIWAIGEDGTRLRAQFDGASGMSGLWYGYTYDAVWRPVPPNFRPKEILVRWAHGYQPLEVEFTLRGVPLGKE